MAENVVSITPFCKPEAGSRWNATETLDATYNERFARQEVYLPADAARVELVSAITGHGMSQPGNCAEFCNTDHHFLVNTDAGDPGPGAGTDNVRDFPGVSNIFGCQEQIDAGTVPNQHGTWWFGRAGWCPGKQVDHHVFDITDQVALDAVNGFDYEGYYLGEPYSGDNWRHIHVAAWLVLYR
jgi:hypothetical protein